MRNKVFSVQHEFRSGMFLDFILLPVGYRLNAEARSAMPGDSMNFLDGVTVQIERVIEMNAKDPVSDALCRCKYGKPIRVIIEQWKVNSAFLGGGRNAVDENVFIAVFYVRSARV